jgi:hypothetical protein
MPPTIVWVACDPALFNGATEMQFTLENTVVGALKPITPGPPWTVGQEVDEALKVWYTGLGKRVPPIERGIGAKIDAASAAEEATFMAEVAAAEEELPSVVPPFGTPEFWDYHRKKKELENKRRAAEGLPPLPTKKELEAEKEKKRKEKEAEKEKKQKEKEAVAAEKLAAKMAKMKI